VRLSAIYFQGFSWLRVSTLSEAELTWQGDFPGVRTFISYGEKLCHSRCLSELLHCCCILLGANEVRTRAQDHCLVNKH